MQSPIQEISYSGQHLDASALLRDARPLVLRSLCADWPLVTMARQSDTAFAQELARHDNGSPVSVLLMPPDAGGRIGFNAALDGFNYESFGVSITDALQRLAAYARNGVEPHGVALISATLAHCAPGLVPTHRVPFLDPSVEPRLWMGNHVTTPAHFDALPNIAVVACGRRRFTLFPPEQARNLYVGPLDFAPSTMAISMPALEATDDARWPRLKEALAHAQSAVLEPGDAIFVPPLWWHNVESLGRLNALINFWWAREAFPGHVPEAGMQALLHCFLAYKWLPVEERAAWLSLLDHYVFGAEDPAMHIPAGRRGVLGPLTAETEA